MMHRNVRIQEFIRLQTGQPDTIGWSTVSAFCILTSLNFIVAVDRRGLDCDRGGVHACSRRSSVAIARQPYAC